LIKSRQTTFYIHVSNVYINSQRKKKLWKKLHNKAAVNNPLFTQKRERTLDMLIKNLHQEYMSEINKVGTFLREAAYIIYSSVYVTAMAKS
jgi:hypothetical protein